MPLNLKNLDFIKGIRLPDAPDFGIKLAEMITEMAQGVNNIEQQTNTNATGDPTPPPPLNSLDVRAANGMASIGLNHEGADFYRGANYFVEHSATPDFQNPQIVDLGTSRNVDVFVGNGQRYFRAYPSYPGSPPGPLTYFGDGARPIPIIGGGNAPPPPFARSQGSGTGTAGQGHSGFGPTPYRTSNGKPPVR